MIEFLPRAGVAAGLEFPTRRALVPPDRTTTTGKATGVPAIPSLRAEPIQDRQVRRPGDWSASRIALFSVLMDFADGAFGARDRARRTPESDAAGQRERRNSSRPLRPGATRTARADRGTGSPEATRRQVRSTAPGFRPGPPREEASRESVDRLQVASPSSSSSTGSTTAGRLLRPGSAVPDGIGRRAKGSGGRSRVQGWGER